MMGFFLSDFWGSFSIENFIYERDNNIIRQ